MVAQIGEGPPIDLDLGRCREHTPGVTHAYVAQRHRAIYRAVDPPDLKAQAGFGREAANLVSDEAAAGIGVQPQQRYAQQYQHRRDDAAHPDRDPPRPHQKACPIET